MGYFLLVVGACAFVGIVAAKITAALRTGKAREHDERIQKEIDQWRAEQWRWLRRTEKAEETTRPEPPDA